MSRDLLAQALEAVETARDATADSARRERLDQLASHLQSQAKRDATPALGTLDRVQTKLRAIETDADEPPVTASLAEARDHIISFLGTLDDRGMKQHREGTTSSNDDS